MMNNCQSNEKIQSPLLQYWHDLLDDKNSLMIFMCVKYKGHLTRSIVTHLSIDTATYYSGLRIMYSYVCLYKEVFSI